MRLLALILPLLAACAEPTWTPTTANPPPLQQTVARCQLQARSSPAAMLNGGVYPSGALMELCMNGEGYQMASAGRNGGQKP